MDGTDASFLAVSDFECHLSQFIADSGLSAYDALLAIGISLARVLYGLELLHGKEAALDACELLDETMVKAWHDFADRRPVVN